MNAQNENSVKMNALSLGVRQKLLSLFPNVPTSSKIKDMAELVEMEEKRMKCEISDLMYQIKMIQKQKEILKEEKRPL